jgi:hypothetical protein
VNTSPAAEPPAAAAFPKRKHTADENQSNAERRKAHKLRKQQEQATKQQS